MIKFTKKLSLNKETIAHLRSIDMKKVAGGVGTIFPYNWENFAWHRILKWASLPLPNATSVASTLK
jgi:hypothetical protein